MSLILKLLSAGGSLPTIFLSAVQQVQAERRTWAVGVLLCSPQTGPEKLGQVLPLVLPSGGVQGGSL